MKRREFVDVVDHPFPINSNRVVLDTFPNMLMEAAWSDSENLFVDCVGFCRSIPGLAFLKDKIENDVDKVDCLYRSALSTFCARSDGIVRAVKTVKRAIDPTNSLSFETNLTDQTFFQMLVETFPLSSENLFVLFWILCSEDAACHRENLHMRVDIQHVFTLLRQLYPDDFTFESLILEDDYSHNEKYSIDVAIEICRQWPEKLCDWENFSKFVDRITIDERILTELKKTVPAAFLFKSALLLCRIFQDTVDLSVVSLLCPDFTFLDQWTDDELVENVTRILLLIRKRSDADQENLADWLLHLDKSCSIKRNRQDNSLPENSLPDAKRVKFDE